MIDTIVLVLSSDMYTIVDPDKFKSSARWLDNSSHATLAMQSKQNPTKTELKCGIYKPRLLLAQRYDSKGNPDITLKIELSLPKLLFGNNFDELTNEDFLPVAHKLVAQLEQMGVETLAATLAKATVLAIHYAKNIPLTDGSCPHHFIHLIRQANIRLSLDVNQTDYRNDGHSYKWHCNAYEVVFYDKLKELEHAHQGTRRTMEKDGELQLALLKLFQYRKKFELLRIEVRLNKRQKIKQLLSKQKIKTDLTFAGLFKEAIVKKILLHYLDELESKRPAILDYEAPDDNALLAALIVNNPKMGAKQILQMFGFKKALETGTCRELRTMFARYNSRSWYRLIADAKKIKLPDTPSPFVDIRKAVSKFKPLKLGQMQQDFRK